MNTGDMRTYSQTFQEMESGADPHHPYYFLTGKIHDRKYKCGLLERLELPSEYVSSPGDVWGNSSPVRSTPRLNG